MGKIVSAMMVVCVAIILSACSQSGDTDSEKKVVLASKPMTEQYILGEILTELIEKNSDITVEKKFGIGGGTSNIHPAMLKGEIDIYPEYTGTGWLAVLRKKSIKDSDILFDSVKKQYAAEYDIYWSERYGFDNTYSLAVRKETADKYGLKTFDDLARVSSELVMGANPDFYERKDGFAGLKKEYTFTFKKRAELDISLRYKALQSREVDVITAFNTEPRVQEFNLVLLKDNRHFFQSYHAATLARNQVIKKYPELKKILALLDGQISDEEMLEMNYKVEILKKDPKAVALEFIEEKGL